MKSLIPIIIISIFLNNCGFKPIYSSKNSNFEIIEVINKNENKNSFALEKMILSLSNKDANTDPFCAKYVNDAYIGSKNPLINESHIVIASYIGKFNTYLNESE